jgi:hypothetical protein
MLSSINTFNSSIISPSGLVTTKIDITPVITSLQAFTTIATVSSTPTLHIEVPKTGTHPDTGHPYSVNVNFNQTRMLVCTNNYFSSPANLTQLYYSSRANTTASWSSLVLVSLIVGSTNYTSSIYNSLMDVVLSSDGFRGYIIFRRETSSPIQYLTLSCTFTWESTTPTFTLVNTVDQPINSSDAHKKAFKGAGNLSSTPSCSTIVYSTVDYSIAVVIWDLSNTSTITFYVPNVLASHNGICITSNTSKIYYAVGNNVYYIAKSASVYSTTAVLFSNYSVDPRTLCVVGGSYSSGGGVLFRTGQYLVYYNDISNNNYTSSTVSGSLSTTQLSTGVFYTSKLGVSNNLVIYYGNSNSDSSEDGNIRSFQLTV